MQLPLSGSRHDPCVSHLTDYPRKLLLAEKAKSCPRPAKKQNRVHNLSKSKSGTTTLGQSRHTISSREQKKGSQLTRSVMTPDRRNPFISQCH